MPPRAGNDACFQPFMRAWHFSAVLLVVWTAMAGAQAPGSSDERGSIPPGTSRDESRPGEGAIEGGSVGARKPDAPVLQSGRAREQEMKRCMQLKGALREQCLEDLNNASAGAARSPSIGTPRGPAAPPPQNPQPQ